jgi:hypothetical protein
MIWLFALGIIVLALAHQGFRKLVYWLLGLSTAGLAMIIIWAASQGQI